MGDTDLICNFNAVSITSVGFGLFWRCRLLGPIVEASAMLLLRFPVVLAPALLFLRFRWFALVVVLAPSLSVAVDTIHSRGGTTEGGGLFSKREGVSMMNTDDVRLFVGTTEALGIRDPVGSTQ